MRPWLALAAAALGGAPAWAETPSPPFAGVWAGTLGTARIQVCLVGDGSAEYYYLRHKRGIRLEAPGASANANGADLIARALASGRLELEERMQGPAADGKLTGRWKLQPDDKGGLVGAWTAPDGKAQAPIQLARVTAPFKTRVSYAGGDDCHPSFYEPLRSGLRLKMADAKFEGHAYRTVETGQATALELPPGTPHAATINAHAIDWLKDQAVLAYQCEIGRGGTDEPLGSSLAPAVWSQAWLVLRDLLPDTYCGGAHGNAALSYVTWSLERGERVDTWKWIQGGGQALKVRQNAAGDEIKAPLMQLLEQLHPRNQKDDECAEVIEQMDLSAPYPTSTALVFPTTFFHAMRACSDEITLSWKQAAPFLSAQGRAAMAASTKAAPYSPR